MKKKISLVLLLLIAMTAILVACNNTLPTEKRIRWEDNETHTFSITLADYNANSTDATDLFNSYGGYQKDFAISSYESLTMDELRPADVNGDYTMTISIVEGKKFVDLETTQNLELQYKLSALNEALGQDNVTAMLAEFEQKGLVVSSDSETVTLKSTTITTVRFENSPEQIPVRSSTEVEGFYLGYRHWEYSKYSVATEYDFEAKRPMATVKVKMGDEEETENTYKLASNSAGRIIDSNQLMLYLRSLDKSSTSFQDSPSISVYSPLTNETQTARFTLAYSSKAILTDDDTDIYTTLNTVAVTVGTHPFMVQENLPDRLQGYDLDKMQGISANIVFSKFTTVRFRVGYLAYEIADYSEDQYAESIACLFAERWLEANGLVSGGETVAVNGSNYENVLTAYNKYEELTRPDYKAAIEKILAKTGDKSMSDLKAAADAIADEVASQA